MRSNYIVRVLWIILIWRLQYSFDYISLSAQSILLIHAQGNISVGIISLVQVICSMQEDTLPQVFQSPTTETVSFAVLWIRDYWGWCYRVEKALLAPAGGSLLRSHHQTNHKSVSARPHWKLIDRQTEELVTWRWCAIWSNQFNMGASVFTWNWWSLALIQY